ncbi:MAG: DUF977 family protein [Ignavibacteriales bacterium]|nr:DUF977 family protein [Ignavibacteriales bacterium]
MASQDIKAQIPGFAKKDRVVTTAEIAKQYGISWNTAEKYLLELALDGKFRRIKKAGVNLWVLI